VRRALRSLILAVALASAFYSSNQAYATHGDTVGDTRQIAIVFVQPVGETLTGEEQADGALAVSDAAAFWEQHSPIAVRLAIASSVVITAGDEVYTASGAMGLPRPYSAGSSVAIFLVDNSAARRLFEGGRTAMALLGGGLVWAVLYGVPGPDGLAATLAHELGHAVFGLVDLIGDPVDIMSPALVSAYQAGVIGCRSRAALGAPCLAIYLPLVVASAERNQARDWPLGLPRVATFRERDRSGILTYPETKTAL